MGYHDGDIPDAGQLNPCSCQSERARAYHTMSRLFHWRANLYPHIQVVRPRRIVSLRQADIRSHRRKAAPNIRSPLVSPIQNTKNTGRKRVPHMCVTEQGRRMEYAGDGILMRRWRGIMWERNVRKMWVTQWLRCQSARSGLIGVDRGLKVGTRSIWEHAVFHRIKTHSK